MTTSNNTTDKINTLLHFQKSLLQLEKEDPYCFEDTTFIKSLEGYISNLYASRQFDTLLRVLNKVGTYSLDSQIPTRERSLYLLSQILFLEKSSKERSLTQPLATILAKWLIHEQNLISGFEYVNRLFHELVSSGVQNSKHTELELFYLVVNCILNGQIDKPNSIHKTLFTVFSKTSKHNMHAASPRLPDIQVKPLINELFTSRIKERRLAILSMLSCISKYVAETIVEIAKVQPSWYVLRNTTDIVSHTFNKEQFSLLFPFLELPDRRIQNYILSKLSQFPAHDAKSMLLKLLENSRDDIKIRIVPMLSQFDTIDKENSLLALLSNRNHYNPKFRDAIIKNVIHELGRIPSIFVVHSLERFIHEQSQLPKKDDVLIQTAKKTISALWQG